MRKVTTEGLERTFALEGQQNLGQPASVKATAESNQTAAGPRTDTVELSWLPPETDLSWPASGNGFQMAQLPGSWLRYPLLFTVVTILSPAYRGSPIQLASARPPHLPCRPRKSVSTLRIGIHIITTQVIIATQVRAFAARPNPGGRATSDTGRPGSRRRGEHDRVSADRHAGGRHRGADGVVLPTAKAVTRRSDLSGIRQLP
jgi:hypothetical protein